MIGGRIKKCSTWNHYLPRWTISIEMSAGETPAILDACPSDLGFILLSFSRASKERAVSRW